MNLTAGTAKIFVVVEALPESEQRLGTGLGTSIKQDAHLWVQDATKGVEKPAMRVNLFAVLLLQAEDELHWWKGSRAVVRWPDELLVWRDGELGGVLKDVGNGIVAVNILLHHTILVYTDSGKHVKNVLVDLLDTIKNQADYNLLPGRATPVPERRLLQVHYVPDILHDAVECSREENLVFVVVGNGNKKLGVPVVHARAQIVTILESEVVGIASGRSVAHLEKLLILALDVSVLGLNSISDGTGHWVVDAQNGTLNELDLSGSIALQATSWGSVGILALNPAIIGLGDRVPRVSILLIAESTIGRHSVLGGTGILVGVSVGRGSGLNTDASPRSAGIGCVRLGQAVCRDWTNWRSSGAQTTVVVGLVVVEERGLDFIVILPIHSDISNKAPRLPSSTVWFGGLPVHGDRRGSATGGLHSRLHGHQRRGTP